MLRDALGSIAIHAAVLTALFLAPDVQPSTQAPLIASNLKRSSVKIFAPKFLEPTQTAPNKGKPTRELDLSIASEGAKPQPRRFLPPGLPSGPPRAAAPPIVEAVPLDSPRIEATAPNLGAGGTARLAPPLPSAPKPKIDPNAKPAQLTPLPDSQKGILPPPSGAGNRGGALGENLPSLPGLDRSTLELPELLSDPHNVDFKPYLVQVAAVVKRNWLRIFPQLRLQGVVVIKFSIDRSGTISGVTISSSGIGEFDRAAVTGISMSNPLPPLPPGYTGDQIRLQMKFLYNTAR